jgi:hypothetical protein
MIPPRASRTAEFTIQPGDRLAGADRNGLGPAPATRNGTVGWIVDFVGQESMAAPA